MRNLFLLALSACVLSCTDPQPQNNLELLSGQAFGTTYNISIRLNESEDFQKTRLVQRIESLEQEFNQIFSTYDKSSEINRFNLQTLPNQSFQASIAFLEILQKSQELHEFSNGYFDPSVGKLVADLGLGSKLLKTEESLEEKRKQLGFEYLMLNRETQTLEKKRNFYLDLSGIAKGLFVDEVAKIVAEKHANYLVEVGGEIRLSGTGKSGQGWRIAIEAPGSLGETKEVLVLQSGSLATSGDYRNFIEDSQNQKKTHHILNPVALKNLKLKDNLQFQDIASATVYAEDCYFADSIATALMAMGFRAAKEFIIENNISAYIIHRDTNNKFSSFVSEEFTPLLVAD